MSFFYKVYPSTLRNREILTPVIPFLRSLSIPFTFLLVKARIHPNIITGVSFFTLGSSVYWAFNGVFQIAFSLMFITLLLDCIDGQVARFLGKQSSLGQKMEAIHADFLLLFFPTAVAVGLYRKEILSLSFIFFIFVSAAMYVNWRGILSISSVEDDPNGRSFFRNFLYAQQKPNDNIRNSQILGKLFFILRSNLTTQVGILFFLTLVLGFIDHSFIPLPLILMAAAQFLIAIAIIILRLILNEE
jgi:phosphatidylglycerophosphate synthase